MYSKCELIEIATRIIDLSVTVNIHSFNDISIDEEEGKLKDIKCKLMKDWIERFGNKELALFCLSHCVNTYFEQGGDCEEHLEEYIWNKKHREDKYFILELEARMLSNLTWVG